MKRAATHQVAIDHAGLIDERTTADLKIKLAFWYRGHATTSNAIRVGRDLDAVTDAGDRLVGFEKITRDADQIFIVANVLWSSSSGK